MFIVWILFRNINVLSKNESRKNPKINSLVSFNTKLSVAEKLKNIIIYRKKGAFALNLITIEFQYLQ